MQLLKRKIDKYLFEWKNDPNHMPLIVKGARQIGNRSNRPLSKLTQDIMNIDNHFES